MSRSLFVVVWLLTSAAAGAAAASQQPPIDPSSPSDGSNQSEQGPEIRGQGPGVRGQDQATTGIDNPVAATTAPLRDGGHRLGPHDVVAVAVLQAPELNTSVRVSEQGDVSLPLLGQVRASGLTTTELETAIQAQLGAKYIREPHVTVRLTELHSQPVSLMGAVKRPGTYQLQGAGTLLEALALAGGLADDAGDKVRVQRGRARASAASSGQPQALDADCAAGDAGRCQPIVEVDLKALLASRDPALNVAVGPGDVIAVQSAAVVYVVGAIGKPGSFYVRGNEHVTVLRALALAGGLTPVAATHDAVVLRDTPQGTRVEIAVDLDAVLKGRAPDVPLEAQDVLFVPTSGAKVAARVTLDTMIRIVSFRLW